MTNKAAIGQKLTDFLGQGELAAVIAAIAEAAKPIAERIARGALAGDPGVALGDGASGDVVRELDVFADEQFEHALRGAGVRGFASEQRATPVELDAKGKFLVSVGPLDGAAHLDVNLTVGSIVSVLEAPERAGLAAHDFLQPGHRQHAAAVIVYGPHVDMLFTTGAGAHVATYDRAAGEFRMVKRHIQIPEGKAEFAINASNERHWPDPVRAYVEDCLMGESGPRGKEFNMRWIASLCADALRIFTRGGVYLYPDDSRAGYGKGRLRLLYEANPIALLTEQAGGLATDGINRILDIVPSEWRQRTPLIFGSTDKVELIRSYFVEGHSSASRSPLFGKRGLLRG